MAITVGAVASAASAVSGTNVITTYAGTTFGNSGDGGPATAAQMRSPVDVAFDGLGNAYIADDFGLVRKVDSSGTITTFASGLSGPRGVAADGLGNVYIADTFGDRVRKVDSSGKLTTFAGGGTKHLIPYGDGGPATDASIWGPHDVVADGQGNVYITDNHHLVRRVDSAGTITTVAGRYLDGQIEPPDVDGMPATDLQLWDPVALALDGHGNLYVAHGLIGGIVRKVDAAGKIFRVAGDGDYGRTGDCGAATAASLEAPRGLAFDGAGDLYISDAGSRSIRMVDSAGKIRKVAGGASVNGAPWGDGGPATDASVDSWGIAFDAQGNLYIADNEHYRVRKVVVGQTAKATQTIFFQLYDEYGDFLAGPQTYGGPPFAHNAAASSCLPLGFTATGGCTVSGSLIHITGAGSCTITASQPGNADYFAATNASQTFTIGKAAQTISFGPVGNKRVGDPDFVIGASASSGLPVAFTASGRCTISGATVHITGAGSCFIIASQPGDANWLRASEVYGSFVIGKADQTIAFGALPDRTLGGPDFTVSASASSGLSVSFSATGQCRMSAVTRVQLTGVGSCAIRASQSGNANYNAASPVSRSFSVTQGAGTRPKAKTCKVPNVRGKRLAVAKRLIKRRGCRTGRVRYKHSGLRRGIVLSQSRRAGRVVPAGTKINLGVSR